MVAFVNRDDPSLRMNDGKVDPAGRFWAGTMAYDERSAAGALYRLDADYMVHEMLTEVTISNGLDWSDDGRFMYFVDSGAHSIDRFDFDVERGAISNRTTIVTIPDSSGLPDGMTLDAEGALWVAIWNAGVVHRFAPDGSLLAIVEVPASQVTSCSFGGMDLGDLYITSGTEADSAADKRKLIGNEPESGSVFRCRPGVHGRPPHRFKG